MMKANEIRQRILKELPSLLPTLRLGKIEIDKKISGWIFDLTFKIKTQNRQEWLLVCEIKELLQPRMAREISAQFKEKLANLNKVYPVVITTFLGERTREILKKGGIGYLDLAGNCYLEFNNIYIERIVDKNPFVDKRRIKTIFKPISSRIVRVLLEEPKKKWKILELSQVARVSLGQVSNVCRWLIDEEYLKKNKGGLYSLTEPGKLLDEWQRNYTYTQNKMFAYYSFEQNLGKLIKKVRQFAEDKNLRYALTLLSGASLVAPFIRGVSSLQMYISNSENLPEWIRLLDLRPVESGSNISIYIPYDGEVFYEVQKVNDINIVGNIQLYLDLYNYPARGREQAEFLRREKIKF
ncbi:hypothetical protein KAU86_00010 [bacterium]|nr:hypothetical protein [bacterium]MCK4436315.1 hypothetical protein [bacterium]